MDVAHVISLPFNDEVVDKSIDNAIRKLFHTISNLMYTRSPMEIFDNIVMGDIAKNSIVFYLRQNCNKPIIDYDEIRDDDFKNSDPGWDFQFGLSKIKVEVKSSIPTKNENKADIIKLRDIKITASHDKGTNFMQVKDIVSDIHLQVYFYSITYRQGCATIKELYELIKNDTAKAKSLINIQKYKEPLFFGWDTKENIGKYHAQLRPNTWTFAMTNRIYWRCPICQAKDLAGLVNLINLTE